MTDAVETVQPKRKIGLAAVLVPIAVLSVCGGALFSFSQYAVVSRVVQTAANVVPTSGAASGTSMAVAPSDDAEAEEDGEPIEFGFFHEITGMTINPAGTNGSRYLLVNAALEADDEKTIAQIQEREFVVRDRLIGVMSRRTVPELADITLREALKDSLLTSINAVVDEGSVSQLYFTQYVMQ
jgi:flagellar FliL protein